MKHIILYIYLICLVKFSYCQNDINHYEVGRYYGIGEIVESYMIFHYDSPKNMTELIKFCDYIGLDKYFNSTIIKMKEDIEHFTFKDYNGYCQVEFDDSILVEVPLREPCIELEDDISFYMGNVLFFNKQEYCIVSDRLMSDFTKGIKKVQYKYANKDNWEIELILMKYENNIGLNSYCNEDISNLDQNYILQIERFLMKFCSVNSISKIIFVSRIPFTMQN